MRANTESIVTPIPDNSPSRSERKSRSKFYFGVAVAMSVAVFIGFGPSFYLNALFEGPQSPLPAVNTWPLLKLVHGLVFSAWMILLMLQTGLVANGQVTSHRRLGYAGALVAASMVVLGIALQLRQTHTMLGSGEFDRNYNLGPNVFVGAIVAMIVFGFFMATALYYRRNRETHKRLILIATAALIPAATGRMVAILGFFVTPAIAPFGTYVSLFLVDLTLVALALHDWRTIGRLHPATLWGGVCFLAVQALINFKPLVGSQAVSDLARVVAG